MITGTVSSSKLDGALPALNGANLTGVGDGVLKGGNDPATDTNPAAGVGAVWLNTSSGSMYICTDATTDANVWINVGGGSGDVQLFIFQGSIWAFNAGGNPGSGWGGTPTDQISKFSLTSDANGVDVANLTDDRQSTAGCSSATHGYTMSGYHANTAPGGGGYLNVVDKFSFTTGTDATDVGDLSVQRASMAAASSGNYAYASGGDSAPGDSNVIDKTSTSTDGNATNVGDITVARQYTAGQSSSSHGYISGGRAGGPARNEIDYFPFASDTNASDVGDMTSHRDSVAGQSSTTHGFVSGGVGNSNVIEKFSFASLNNATDVGDLTVGRMYCTGQSGTTHGYTSGGTISNTSLQNVIDKFAYSSNNNATDVGDMAAGRKATAGTQY